MNSSYDDSPSSVYYYNLDDLLTNYGSTWPLDIFNMYPFTIVAVIAFLLQVFSFIIFMNKAEFDNVALFKYMRVYTLNGAFICLLNIFNFVYSTIRINAWSNSEGAQAYYNFIASPVSDLSYFYSGVIEILILVDRISALNRQFKSIINRVSPYTLSAICLVACVILDTPYFISYQTGVQTFILNDTQRSNFTIWYSGPNTLVQIRGVKVFVSVALTLREILIMVLEIGLNLVSIYYLKSYIKRKMKLSIKPAAHTEQNATFNTVAKTQLSKLPKPASRASSAESKSTAMVSIICVVSVLQHVIILTAFLYSMLHVNLMVFVFYAINNFSYPFRRLIDFFLFFVFNKKFRIVFFRYLKCQFSNR